MPEIRGVVESRGEIISFVDDGVTVSVDWLGEVAKAFQQCKPICVGTRVLLKVDVPKPAWRAGCYDPALGELDKRVSIIVGDVKYLDSIA